MEMELNKIVFFVSIPYEGVFHMLCQRKKVKIDIFKILSHMVALSRNSEKTEDILKLLLITENARNKQTIKGKDSGKNKKGIDPEVNEIVSCGKKWEKMFHALHKVDMRACYAKQRINLACPNAEVF